MLCMYIILLIWIGKPIWSSTKFETYGGRSAAVLQRSNSACRPILYTPQLARRTVAAGQINGSEITWRSCVNGKRTGDVLAAMRGYSVDTTDLCVCACTVKLKETGITHWYAMVYCHEVEYSGAPCAVYLSQKSFFQYVKRYGCIWPRQSISSRDAI